MDVECKLRYIIDAFAIKDPQGNVMVGTDEFACEMQSLVEALYDLYRHSHILRMAIADNAPEMQALSAWRWHADSMERSSFWLKSK